MIEPNKWVIGLLPLAVVFLVAALWRQGGVEAELAARGAAALTGAGADWAKVSLSGRDAVLTGEAPSPEQRLAALGAAGEAFGIRQIENRTTLLPESKPFGFSAIRDADKLTLTGSVPPGPARAALLEAAAKSFPGVAITDQLRAARGASAEFGAISAFGLGELAKLSQGAVSLEDNAIGLSGRAADFARFVDVRSKLASLPAGAKLVKGLGPGDILPPVVKPFTFTAEVANTALFGNSGLVLTGVVPSDEARARVLGAAGSLGLGVTDRLQLADGAPAGDWGAAAALVVRGFARLESGRAVLADDKVTVTGKGRDAVTEDDIRNDFNSLPAGYTLASVAVESRAARPYVFTAQRGAGSLTLSGFVPDAKTRGEVLDTARRYFEGDRIEDRLVEGLGPPRDFAAAIRVGLMQLSRLTEGASLALADSAATLRGAAYFDAARDQAAADFRRDLPSSFRASAEVSTAPLPPPVTLPAECQRLYQDALTSGTVRFRSGSADLSDESRGLVDRLVVVTLRCVNARIEIAGHTDSDGNAQNNAELSRRRAETIAAYLARAGIAVDRLEAVGYGQTVPIAPNDTPENKAKNRRIEFTVQ